MLVTKKYIYDLPDNKNHAVFRIIELLDNDIEVLEVGCGSGIQTRQYKERLGCRITGIEIDEFAGEEARPYCDKLIIGNIEHMDLNSELGNKLFDAVIFANVLEHLYAPGHVLKKIRPFLKKQGYIIASIPNISHVAVCWELCNGRFDYNKYGLLDDTHIRFFTKKNVVKVFEESGYQIDSLSRVKKSDRETEFSVHYGSEKDKQFIEWIIEKNPEAFTYQFILKAYANLINMDNMNYKELEAFDDIKKCEAKIAELKQQNMQLKSQIEWLSKNRFGKFTGIINRFFKKSMNKMSAKVDTPDFINKI